MSNIPKGFQLHITTWENDADHYKTQIFSGLTEEDVRFYLAIATKFKSQNNYNDQGLGNGSVTPFQMKEVINAAFASYPNISPEIKKFVVNCQRVEEDEDEGEGYHQFLLEILGYTEEYFDELYFCRVFDEAKVYYFPEEVLDVTVEFMEKK
jgi:hypothetical protein